MFRLFLRRDRSGAVDGGFCIIIHQLTGHVAFSCALRMRSSRTGFECSDEKHCGVFLSFCILFLILFRFQCLLQVSQYIDCWRARTTKYVLVPALVLFILSSLRLYTTKALKTLILQGLSGLFPFHKKTGDERIELPPKVLETPIIPFDQSPITPTSLTALRRLFIYNIASSQMSSIEF